MLKCLNVMTAILDLCGGAKVCGCEKVWFKYYRYRQIGRFCEVSLYVVNVFVPALPQNPSPGRGFFSGVVGISIWNVMRICMCGMRRNVVCMYPCSLGVDEGKWTEIGEMKVG
jgi:hypothetical protein